MARSTNICREVKLERWRVWMMSLLGINQLMPEAARPGKDGLAWTRQIFTARNSFLLNIIDHQRRPNTVKTSPDQSSPIPHT